MSDLLPLHVAIDLGAGSGRVIVGGFASDRLVLHEVHRFAHPMAERDGHLRWDAAHILKEILRGLKQASRAAQDLGAAVATLGVDSWGVDYGILDQRGRLTADPVSYRDARTAGEMERVFALVPRAEIFRRTGIQFLALNTIYQLAAERAEGSLPGADHCLLLIGDLFHALLGGRACCEFTNASTTQLLSAATGDWDDEIFRALGLPRAIMAPVVEPGTRLGYLATGPAQETGLGPVAIVAPATHDTASAVAGTPLMDGWVYVSSGTWSLVGLERPAPLLDAAALQRNFTNEGGAGGRTLLLKNVMGMWLLDRCRQEWQARGTPLDYSALARLEPVSTSNPGAPLATVDPDDERFFNPPSMVEAIEGRLHERGFVVPGDPPGLARVILDSLARKYARVVSDLHELTGESIRGIQVVGGGSQNLYLNQAAADACGVPVVAGPVEATALGNLAVQAVATGRFGSLRDARSFIRSAVSTTTFVPRQGAAREAT